MNLDAPFGRAPAVTPRHRVMARDRPGRVVQRPEYRRVSAAGQIDLGAGPLDLGRVDHLGVDPVVLVDLGAPAHRAHGRIGVCQSEVAARRIKQVEAEFLGQLLPQTDTGVVELHALRGQVVGADDGRVATGIASAQVSLLQNRDVGDTVVARQVVGIALEGERIARNQVIDVLARPVLDMPLQHVDELDHGMVVIGSGGGAAPAARSGREGVPDYS